MALPALLSLPPPQAASSAQPPGAISKHLASLFPPPMFSLPLCLLPPSLSLEATPKTNEPASASRPAALPAFALPKSSTKQPPDGARQTFESNARHQSSLEGMSGRAGARLRRVGGVSSWRAPRLFFFSIVVFGPCTLPASLPARRTVIHCGHSR